MRRWIAPAVWVLVTLMVISLLWEIRVAILILVFALFLSGAIRPLHRALTNRGMERTYAVLLVYSGLFVAGVLLLVAVVPGLGADIDHAVSDALESYRRLREQQTTEEWLGITRLNAFLPDSRTIAQILRQDIPTLLGTKLLEISGGILSMTGQLGLVMIVSLYWSLDRRRLESYIFSFFSPWQRREFRELWNSIFEAIGRQLRAELIMSLAAAFLMGLLCSALDFNYPVFAGFWAGMVRLIPWTGPILATMPLLLVPHGSIIARMGIALCALAALIVIEQIFWRRWRPHQRPSRFVVAVLILVLGSFTGLAGVVLASSAAAAIHTVLIHLSVYPQSPPAASLDQVRTRLDAVQSAIVQFEKLKRAEQWRNLGSRIEGIIERAQTEFDLDEMDGRPT